MSRELAFLHAHGDCSKNDSRSSSHQADDHTQPSQVRINFALNNNSVVSFGQGVAASWMVGNYDNSEEVQERGDNGTVAVIVHGFAKDVIEESLDPLHLQEASQNNMGTDRSGDKQKVLDSTVKVATEVDNATNQNSVPDREVDNSEFSGLEASSPISEAAAPAATPAATSNAIGNHLAAQEESFIIDLCDDGSEDGAGVGDGHTTEDNKAGGAQESHSLLHLHHPIATMDNHALVQPFRIGSTCTISKNDVVLSKNARHGPGNNRFRELIKESAKVYTGKGFRDHKTLQQYAANIIRSIRSMQPKGRFLMLTHASGPNEEGVWYDVGTY